MTQFEGSILLVGGGRMGQAMLGGWLASGIPASHIKVVEPSADIAATITSSHAVEVVDNKSALSADWKPTFVVFAVKPQVIRDVVETYQGYITDEMVCLSVAAGKTLSFFASLLGDAIPFIRVMPNLPSFIGKGASALCANHVVTDAHRTNATILFEAIGVVCWIEDETQMDAVTAISGSGPAYVFLFHEVLERAAEELGLPKEVGALLAKQTLCGSAEMIEKATQPSSALREGVTSPGGTTAAALAVFQDEKEGLAQLVKRATKAAADRSCELAE